MEVNKGIAAAVIALGAGARLLPHPAIELFSGAKPSKLRTVAQPSRKAA